MIVIRWHLFALLGSLYALLQSQSRARQCANSLKVGAETPAVSDSDSDLRQIFQETGYCLLSFVPIVAGLLDPGASSFCSTDNNRPVSSIDKIGRFMQNPQDAGCPCVDKPRSLCCRNREQAKSFATR